MTAVCTCGVCADFDSAPFFEHVNNKTCVGGDECDCNTCLIYGRISTAMVDEGMDVL